MPAYFVLELEITNQTAMEPYRAAVGATIEQYGGRLGHALPRHTLPRHVLRGHALPSPIYASLGVFAT